MIVRAHTPPLAPQQNQQQVGEGVQKTVAQHDMPRQVQLRTPDSVAAHPGTPRDSLQLSPSTGDKNEQLKQQVFSGSAPGPDPTV